MSVLVATNSRLRFANLVSSDGVTFWDVLDLDPIPQQSDDLKYTALSSDRIDRIAHKFYGDPVLWWVIALASALMAYGAWFIARCPSHPPAETPEVDSSRDMPPA